MINATLQCLPLVGSVLAALLFSWPVHGEDVIDSPMYRTPNLPKANVVNRFPDELLNLWLEALGRPEADLRREAALAIATARERGMKGLEAAANPLARELERTDQHASVRLAVARAIVVLDARAQAPQLMRAASDDGELREIVDPALAQWDYKPARAGWLERLNHRPPKRSTALAIQALATVHEEKAVEPLRALIHDQDVSPALRLEAARALAGLRRSGLEADAALLAVDRAPSGVGARVAAATLLRHHDGDAAVRQLLSLARDAEPAVAKLALTRLVEIDAKLVEPMLDAILANPDAGVRGTGVEALRRWPSDDHLRRLGDRLADAHSGVRGQARRALRDLAAHPPWRGLVARELTRTLAADDWRGQEQAALLAGQIDHKPASQRLVELLSAQRPEPCVASAWALRQIAVPNTLPAVLAYFQRTFAEGVTAGERKLPEDAVDAQLCQLAQFIGQARYRPADGLFRQLIPPRVTAGFEARAAAIWALGYIHEGKPGAGFAAALGGRLNAVVPGDLEDVRVRRMSAVALGLMKDDAQMATLRRFYSDRKASLNVVNNACGWAIEQITGERMPAGTVEVRQINWFLVPIK